MGVLIDYEKKIADWYTKANEVASNHTQVTGVLAGFSITVAILVASIKLAGDASSIYIQASFGLFLAAFFGYVSSGILYTLSIERDEEYQYFLFSIASLIFYLSVALSFAALVLLTGILSYPQVRPGAITALICAIVGGYVAVAIPIYGLLKIRAFVLIIFFITSFLCALVFHVIMLDLPAKQMLSLGLPATILVIGTAVFLSCITFFDGCFITKQNAPHVSIIFLFVITASIDTIALRILL